MVKPAPDYVAVKIGGSLFSDKSVPGSLNAGILAAYAAALRELWRAHPGRVLLITGGGAFGHGAVRGHSTDDPASLVALTEATGSVRWAWTAALRSESVDVLPLQPAAMCVFEGDEPILRSTVILDCLHRGLLPVLSGDCLLSGSGLRTFSSDRVPELLPALLPGKLRVVTFSDVPGIIADGPGGDQVLREIDAADPAPAYRALWRNSEWDATGGMRTKLDALVACARAGAECFIMRGLPGEDLEFLFSAVHDGLWPAHRSYSRIS